MPKTTVRGTDDYGYVDPKAINPSILSAVASDMAPTRSGPIESRAAVLLELEGIKAAICQWHRKDVGQVLVEASAYSARLTEMWTALQILERDDRQWTRLRTQQVQPVIDEVDRQYRICTSRIALMRQDIDLSR